MSKKSENAHVQIVAVDDGYAQTKTYTIDDDGNEIRQVRRSAVRAGRFGVGSVDGEGYVDLYQTEEGYFTVSDKIESENTAFGDFHTSALDRVLVNHALVKAGFGGKPVNLITGLPVGDYFVNGLKDKDRIERKRANLLKTVTVESTQAEVAHIKDVNVGCQALAAWFDYALGSDLQFREDIEGAVAIIDIGGRTTDIATVISGEMVDHKRSKTEDLGALTVYEGIASAVGSRFNIRDKFPVEMIDKAIRNPNRTMKIFGRDEDISDIIESTLLATQTRIANFIDSVISSGAAMNKVLFVGGGANLFGGLVEIYPRNGKLLDDPEFSNARGFYKFLKYKEANS